MVEGLRQFMAWDTYSRRKIDLVSSRALPRRPGLYFRAGAGNTASQQAFEQAQCIVWSDLESAVSLMAQICSQAIQHYPCGI